MTTPARVIDLLPRLESAVEFLLFGRGNLRQRLCDGYRDHLSPLPLHSFPAGELREIFESIRLAMREYTLGPGQDHVGTIEAAAHLMPGPTARMLARKVFRLYTHAAIAACQEAADGAGRHPRPSP